ncbi:4-aminobutyrate aminotransferase [Solibacillus sp. A46]|uniref:4-aminobutyrate aminotransferase n=1 Tax=Solibacillus faecavium TaxID=2762221 RepID=A0ABR8XXS6_9BACL|nr:4-aminobutyrate aminotransferase [Solibacillus faecavium]MBD8036735.1 4-aminobutyrate aminotransferase [Solibacillus faecavium]
MDDIIGYAVVFIIISGLISENSGGNPLFRKQLKRKNMMMTATLFGILLFFTLNIISGITSMPVSNSITAIGIFGSFSFYIYAKFVMSPKEENQRFLKNSR